jgi:hypothetical protein
MFARPAPGDALPTVKTGRRNLSYAAIGVAAVVGALVFITSAVLGGGARAASPAGVSAGLAPGASGVVVPGGKLACTALGRGQFLCATGDAPPTGHAGSSILHGGAAGAAGAPAPAPAPVGGGGAAPPPGPATPPAWPPTSGTVPRCPAMSCRPHS